MSRERKRGERKSRGSNVDGWREEARAEEKQNAAARRQEILAGLDEEDKRQMMTFMGSVNASARNALQGVVRMLSESGQDPRLRIKKALVHVLTHLDIDRCVSCLETMTSIGQDAMLQLLWLYERYNVPNAGGGMTKCALDHFGRDMGVGIVDEVFRMTEADKEALLLQLAGWDPLKKLKVMKAWEATDPKMTCAALLNLMREEQARGDGPGNLWTCSLCLVKRGQEVEERIKRGEHRCKDRTIDAASLYDYGTKGKGERPDIYLAPNESLFEFTPNPRRRQPARQRQRQRQQQGLGQQEIGTIGSGGVGENTPICAGVSGNAETALYPTRAELGRNPEERSSRPSTGDPGRRSQQQQQQQQQQQRKQLELAVTYAGKDFDPRRMCGACTEELRAAIITSGHDLELWHTVDHERRALLTEQRQNDLLKARWAERERADRQVSELLRFICEANLDAFSRHRLEDRAKAARGAQAAEVRRILDQKLLDTAAIKAGAIKDEALKRLNEREATAEAVKLRLKAALDMDRNYATREPGGLPASTRRRHLRSTKPSDFLEDGTPATPQGATQIFGRAGPPEDDEGRDIQRWKADNQDGLSAVVSDFRALQNDLHRSDAGPLQHAMVSAAVDKNRCGDVNHDNNPIAGAEEVAEILHLRRDVREWQSNVGRGSRFSYLCGRWVGAASDIEQRQRQKRMIEAAEREKQLKERQAAKLRRKLQLAELRAKAGTRATGEEQKKVHRDREAEERKRREGEEYERMRAEEAAQLAGGDSYWGLERELLRLRVIEEDRRLAWEARVRVTREKMVAVRCISELSNFTSAKPPPDPELQQQIDRLLAI